MINKCQKHVNIMQMIDTTSYTLRKMRFVTKNVEKMVNYFLKIISLENKNSEIILHSRLLLRINSFILLLKIILNFKKTIDEG